VYRFLSYVTERQFENYCLLGYDSAHLVEKYQLSGTTCNLLQIAPRQSSEDISFDIFSRDKQRYLQDTLFDYFTYLLSLT
jgi:hypothetical protein